MFGKYLLYMVIMAFGLLLSCSKPNNVLSSSKMIAVITDLDKTDGIASVMRQKGTNSDEAEFRKYYMQILDKHGVSKADFDSSLIWYSKNPKRFENINLRVIENLEKWKKDIAEGKYGKIADEMVTLTLWQQNGQILVKDTADMGKVRFSAVNFALMPHDIYALSFLQKLDSTEKQYSPLVKLKITYADDVTDSVIAVSHTDGLTRKFSFRFPAKRLKRVVSLSADLLQTCDSAQLGFNARFDSILLTRTYNAAVQDTLQKMLLPKMEKPLPPNLRDIPRKMPIKH